LKLGLQKRILDFVFVIMNYCFMDVKQQSFKGVIFRYFNLFFKCILYSGILFSLL
jgi:hypothetical protein